MLLPLFIVGNLPVLDMKQEADGPVKDQTIDYEEEKKQEKLGAVLLEWRDKNEVFVGVGIPLKRKDR